MKRKIAFATCRRFPHLTKDDRSVFPHLQQRGIQVQPLVWDAPDSSTDDFESVVIRSCWDYHLRPRQFLEWATGIGRKGIRLCNPARVVGWNLDKSYLKDLHENGVSIPPTVWLKKKSASNLAAILEGQGWDEAIVKPAISANAFQTWRTSPAQALSHQIALDELLQTSGAIVQRFVENIHTRGEWSLIFFQKKFSHAVLKRAAPEDFRVQEDYGGTVKNIRPPTTFIEQAQRVVDLIAEPLLFARVDGVEIEEKFQLMELELIEPALFLSHDSLAAERFAEVIAMLLKQDQSLPNE